VVNILFFTDQANAHRLDACSLHAQFTHFLFVVDCGLALDMIMRVGYIYRPLFVKVIVTGFSDILSSKRKTLQNLRASTKLYAPKRQKLIVSPKAAEKIFILWKIPAYQLTRLPERAITMLEVTQNDLEECEPQNSERCR
jgi:hypothetical protein